MALNFPDHINISLFQASKILTSVLSQVTIFGDSSLEFRTTENESSVPVLFGVIFGVTIESYKDKFISDFQNLKSENSNFN